MNRLRRFFHSDQNDETSFIQMSSGDTDSTSEASSRRFRNPFRSTSRRKCILINVVILVVLLIVAVVLGVTLSADKGSDDKSSQSSPQVTETVLEVISGKARLIGYVWTDEYENSSSLVYRNTTDVFISLMDTQFQQSTIASKYVSTNVTGYVKGSVWVLYDLTMKYEVATQQGDTANGSTTPSPVSSTVANVTWDTIKERLGVGMDELINIVKQIKIVSDTALSVVNECASGPCSNNGTCVDLVDDYRCDCLAGYTGNECQTDINECDSNPCDHGGTCSDEINQYRCTCIVGFTGTRCQTNIDDCVNKPCLHGGTCKDGIDSYTCKCVVGYYGATCEKEFTDCADQPCKNGGTCTDGRNASTCHCVEGYTGQLCQSNIDDCTSNSCENGGTCSDGVNTFTCSCVDGYTGNTCGTNIDDCSNQPCMHGGSCKDGVNDFKCICLDGYIGNTCQTNINDCTSSSCKNGGSCKDGVHTFTCSCVPGFAGRTCETNIDDCATHPCQHQATCIDLVNDFTCSCIQGFTGHLCEININDCAKSPCKNGGTCIDGVASFTCTCDGTGYRGEVCEIKIYPCDSSPCLNRGTCIDGQTNFTCECFERYTGITCETDKYVVASNTRLRDGKNCYEGRIEVYKYSHWGTVCDDYFNGMAAVIVCNSLGFNGYHEYDRVKFGPGTGPINVNGFKCYGAESSLIQCPREDSAGCSHYEDQGIKCDHTGGSYCVNQPNVNCSFINDCAYQIVTRPAGRPKWQVYNYQVIRYRNPDGSEGDSSTMTSPSFMSNGSSVRVEFKYKLKHSTYRDLTVGVRLSKSEAVQRLWYSRYQRWEEDGVLSYQCVQFTAVQGEMYKIVFEARRGPDAFSQIDIDDIQVTEGSCIDSLLGGKCDMDTPSTCGLTVDSATCRRYLPEYSWAWSEGISPQSSLNIGYMNGTLGAYLLTMPLFGAESDVTVASFSVPALCGRPALRFRYYMHDEDIGSLEILLYVKTRMNVSLWRTTEPTGGRWRAQCVSLDICVTDGDVTFKFKATRGAGIRGQVAIDDVELPTTSCRDCEQNGTTYIHGDMHVPRTNDTCNNTCKCNDGAIEKCTNESCCEQNGIKFVHGDIHVPRANDTCNNTCTCNNGAIENCTSTICQALADCNHSRTDNTNGNITVPKLHDTCNNTCTCVDGVVVSCTWRTCRDCKQNRTSYIDGDTNVPKLNDTCNNTCTCTDGVIGLCTTKKCPDCEQEGIKYRHGDTNVPKLNDACNNTCTCSYGVIGSCTPNICGDCKQNGITYKRGERVPKLNDTCNNTCTCRDGWIGSCTARVCGDCYQTGIQYVDGDPTVPKLNDNCSNICTCRDGTISDCTSGTCGASSVSCQPDVRNCGWTISDKSTAVYWIHITNRPKFSAPRLRLYGEGRARSGILQVYHKHRWLGVCDNGFKNNYNFIYLRAACQLVCKSLGFRTGRYSRRTGQTLNATQYWLANTRCTGDEYDFRLCKHSHWGASPYDCRSSSHYVRFDCLPEDAVQTPVRLIGGSHTNTGVLEVQHNGEWRGVCDRNFTDYDAEVICRMLAFETPRQAIKLNTGVSNTNSSGFWLSNFKCYGDEFDVTDCSYRWNSTSDCSSSNYVNITCLSNVTRNQIRLTGGDTPHRGMVEILHDGVWGGVCDTSFYSTEARIVCKMLGYTTDEAYYYPNQYSYSLKRWLDKVKCTGYESDLEDCAHQGWGTVSCSYYDLIAVRCSGTFANDTVEADQEAVNGFSLIDDSSEIGDAAVTKSRSVDYAGGDHKLVFDLNKSGNASMIKVWYTDDVTTNETELFKLTRTTEQVERLCVDMPANVQGKITVGITALRYTKPGTMATSVTNFDLLKGRCEVTLATHNCSFEVDNKCSHTVLANTERCDSIFTWRRVGQFFGIQNTSGHFMATDRLMGGDGDTASFQLATIPSSTIGQYKSVKFAYYLMSATSTNDFVVAINDVTVKTLPYIPRLNTWLQGCVNVPALSSMTLKFQVARADAGIDDIALSISSCPVIYKGSLECDFGEYNCGYYMDNSWQWKRGILRHSGAASPLVSPSFTSNGSGKCVRIRYAAKTEFNGTIAVMDDLGTYINTTGVRLFPNATARLVSLSVNGSMASFRLYINPNATFDLQHARVEEGTCDDELEVTCDLGELFCGGHCYPGSYRCNGDTECPDRSDERSCNCSQESSFLCGDTGHCIHEHLVCDGIQDCADGSDEVCVPSVNCTFRYNTCGYSLSSGVMFQYGRVAFTSPYLSYMTSPEVTMKAAGCIQFVVETQRSKYNRKEFNMRITLVQDNSYHVVRQYLEVYELSFTVYRVNIPAGVYRVMFERQRNAPYVKYSDDTTDLYISNVEFINTACYGITPTTRSPPLPGGITDGTQLDPGCSSLSVTLCDPYEYFQVTAPTASGVPSVAVMNQWLFQVQHRSELYPDPICMEPLKQLACGIHASKCKQGQVVRPLCRDSCEEVAQICNKSAFHIVNTDNQDILHFCKYLPYQIEDDMCQIVTMGCGTSINITSPNDNMDRLRYSLRSSQYPAQPASSECTYTITNVARYFHAIKIHFNVLQLDPDCSQNRLEVDEFLYCLTNSSQLMNSSLIVLKDAVTLRLRTASTAITGAFYISFDEVIPSSVCNTTVYSLDVPFNVTMVTSEACNSWILRPQVMMDSLYRVQMKFTGVSGGCVRIYNKLLVTMATICQQEESVIVTDKHLIMKWDDGTRFTLHGALKYFGSRSNTDEEHKIVRVRLVGGPSPHEGRVEVLRADGAAGSLAYYKSNFRMAQLVCEAAGFGSVVRDYGERYLGGSRPLPPLLNDLKCYQTDNVINDCYYQWLDTCRSCGYDPRWETYKGVACAHEEERLNCQLDNLPGYCGYTYDKTKFRTEYYKYSGVRKAFMFQGHRGETGTITSASFTYRSGVTVGFEYGVGYNTIGSSLRLVLLTSSGTRLLWEMPSIIRLQEVLGACVALPNDYVGKHVNIMFIIGSGTGDRDERFPPNPFVNMVYARNKPCAESYAKTPTSACSFSHLYTCSEFCPAKQNPVWRFIVSNTVVGDAINAKPNQEYPFNLHLPSTTTKTYLRFRYSNTGSGGVANTLTLKVYTIDKDRLRSDHYSSNAYETNVVETCVPIPAHGAGSSVFVALETGGSYGQITLQDMSINDTACRNAGSCNFELFDDCGYSTRNSTPSLRWEFEDEMKKGAAVWLHDGARMYDETTDVSRAILSTTAVNTRSIYRCMSFRFMQNGTTSGWQFSPLRLYVNARYNNNVTMTYEIPAIPPFDWMKYNVPISNVNGSSVTFDFIAERRIPMGAHGTVGIDNVEVVDTDCKFGLVGMPHCTFDNPLLCSFSWNCTNRSGYQWTRQTGNNTGPPIDGDGDYKGYYMYVDNSLGDVSHTSYLWCNVHHNVTKPRYRFKYRIDGNNTGILKTFYVDYNHKLKSDSVILTAPDARGLWYMSSCFTLPTSFRGRIYLMAERGAAMDGGIAIDSVLVAEGDCPVYNINCNFNGIDCGYIQSAGSWQINANARISTSTPGRLLAPVDSMTTSTACLQVDFYTDKGNTLVVEVATASYVTNYTVIAYHDNSVTVALIPVSVATIRVTLIVPGNYKVEIDSVNSHEACPKALLKCPFGDVECSEKCIPKSAVCNGEIDCYLGSDEDTCGFSVSCGFKDTSCGYQPSSIGAPWHTFKSYDVTTENGTNFTITSDDGGMLVHDSKNRSLLFSTIVSPWKVVTSNHCLSFTYAGTGPWLEVGVTYKGQAESIRWNDTSANYSPGQWRPGRVSIHRGEFQVTIRTKDVQWIWPYSRTVSPAVTIIDNVLLTAGSCGNMTSLECPSGTPHACADGSMCYPAAFKGDGKKYCPDRSDESTS